MGNYFQKKKGECEVFPVPFAVFLNKDNKDYVEPDISVICSKDKITEKGCDGAPDWVIEMYHQAVRIRKRSVLRFTFLRRKRLRSMLLGKHGILSSLKLLITCLNICFYPP